MPQKLYITFILIYINLMSFKYLCLIFFIFFEKLKADNVSQIDFTVAIYNKKLDLISFYSKIFLILYKLISLQKTKENM